MTTDAVVVRWSAMPHLIETRRRTVCGRVIPRHAEPMWSEDMYLPGVCGKCEEQVRVRTTARPARAPAEGRASA